MTLELKETKVLEFNRNTLEDVRKQHDLDHSKMCQAIDMLQEWIQEQEQFIKKDFKRDYLERVIISAKGSIEKAKSRVNKMCTLRTVLAEFFDKNNARKDFPNLKNSLICLYMPKLTEDNCRIFIMQLRSNITSDILMDTYKYSIIMSEYVRLRDYSDGVYVILDGRNANVMDFLANFNVMDARNILSLYMDGYGFRVKAIYILSSSKAINIFVNIIKQMFSTKIGQRIQVFPDIRSLYKHLPKHLLPQDYGGDDKSISAIFENWTEELSSEEHVKYMKETTLQRTKETLRKSDKLNGKYIGMFGNLNLLAVD